MIDVVGLGLWAPGMPNVDAFSAGTLDPNHVDPPCHLAASRAKRGTSRLTRMLGEVFEQAITNAGTDPASVATVFASAWGEIDIMIGLLGQIYDEEPTLSPLRFKHSVHNAASGLVSIAAKNQRFSTALAAGHRSVEAGFLEAASVLRTGECDEVVVAVGEDRLPTPLDRFSGHDGLAVAFCLRRSEGSPRLATLSFPARSTMSEGTVPPVDRRFTANPIAWALPLLAAVREGRTENVRLSGADRPWTVDVHPNTPRRTP